MQEFTVNKNLSALSSMGVNNYLEPIHPRSMERHSKRESDRCVYGRN
jgi:hypothetical protein